MKSRLFFNSIILLASMLIAFAGCTKGPSEGEQPNIIIIMSDDMGFTDIGCYGGEIETPVLDGLAENGLRFTQFYNTARCCPTRASLLSGLYPHQAGMGHMTRDTGLEGFTGEISKNCMTIAEVLKTAGYSTYMAGKWHVARDVDKDGPKYNWPMQRGFERFYGTITGAGSFYDPHTLVRNNTMITAYSDSEYTPDTYYYTDAISDHAVRYIGEHQDEGTDKPFFMYVAYTAAHWPMHALPEDIEKYKGKYDEGFTPTRKARLEKAKSLGIIGSHVQMSEQAVDWEMLPDKEWDIRNMEVYAAMVDRLDQGIGKIVKELEESGQLYNTLIFFLQDNGGCAETWKRKGDIPRADKPTLDPLPADHLFTTYPDQTRDGWPVLSGPAVMPGPIDTYSAYGKGWANVSNTPFREYKHWVHEGGISTPLIVSWPDGIKGSGEIITQPGHLIDLMATCVDVSGAVYPESFNGSVIKPMEGRSLATAFKGKEIDREAIYWEHEGNRAIRVGDWKLVAKRGQEWELYNISEDRSELNNLAGELPDKTTELAEKWEEFAVGANFVPSPWDRRE